MKKLLTAVLASALLVSCCACGEKDVEAPVIDGAVDSTSIALGDSFNALEGLTATDNVDGDITSKITVSAQPTLTFDENGATTPASQGTYELTYEVKDKAGNVGNAYTTLTVTRAVSQESLYKKYTFADAAQDSIDAFGLAPEVAEGAAATMNMTEGVLRLNVTNAGNDAGHVMLNKRQFATEAGHDYEFVFYMKSSVPFMFHFIANNTAAGWAPLGNSRWNVNMGTEYAPYSLKFTAPEGDVNVELLIQMGKFALNDVVNPDAFVLDVLKVDVIESTGTEHDVLKYGSDYANSIEGLETVTLGNAAAEVAKQGDNAVMNITAYPEGNWELRLLQAINTPLVQGEKYKIVAEMTSVSEQYFELMVENKTLEHENRAWYINNQTLPAGEKKTVEFTFTAEQSIEEGAVIRIDMGRTPEGATSNTVTISKIDFYAIEGNKVSERSVHRFIPFDKTTEWDCFNGRDEDGTQAFGGLGTMYAKDGKMVYRIEEISDVDYGNKAFINKITLERGGLYKVKFTVKANKAAQCWFILNPYGKYDPRISEIFDLTAEEQTFEFTTTEELVLDSDFELVFSFGKGYNTEGDLTVEFSAVEIYRLT